MAFLAKKVPKIFPSSKTRKGQDDLLSSPRHGKKRGTSVFQKLIREPNSGNKSCEQEQTLVNKNMHNVQQLHAGEPLDCCGESKNKNFPCNSDGHSHASTLESSPTPIPRETMDTNMLMLSDLPTLEFPSPKSINESIQESINNNQTTPLPPSLKHVPRPIPHENDSPPPPVAIVSFPMEFAFPPPPSPQKSRIVVANSCLTRPPPRACEWDDATIESHELVDDENAEADSHVESSSSLTQQQETANAQGSIIMKPWIERAARLALLQHKANRIISHTNFVALDRQRHREATLLKNLPDHNPRALLASLEKKKQPESTTSKIATKPQKTAFGTRSSIQDSLSCTEQNPPQTNRVVKWHVVRKPYN